MGNVTGILLLMKKAEREAEDKLKIKPGFHAPGEKQNEEKGVREGFFKS